MTDQHTQRDFSKHWQREVKKMREKKRKTRNEEKQDLQKVQKRENRETTKIRTKKVENSDEKRREEKTSNKKMYIRKIMKKCFKWTSVGQVARNVEHCLWPPTRSSWQFACCGFQRAQLLSQFIWIRWTRVLLLSCLFWTRFPGCLFLKTCKCLEVRCVPWEQNCFCLPSSLHDLFVCKSPASCLASTIQLVQFSVRFCCCGSVFFFRIEFTSLFRCSRFPCLFARQLQRWCIFQELLVTLGGLGIVGMYTFESSASRLVLLWLVVSFHPPCLFLLHRLRWLLLVQGWCSLGRPWWILPSLSTSCWNSCGCEHRDGFWLGFFLSSLLPSAGCSFLPPDVVRASSLWHVLRILTLFLTLTGTTALHVLKLDGVSASARHVWRDLMVSFVYLYFCWPLLRFEVASVPGRFLAWHAGPRVVRELILFCLCPLCVPLFLVTAFKLPSVCLPVHRDTYGIFEHWSESPGPCFFFLVSLPHAWSRNVTYVYGIFFSVAVFSVLVLGLFSRPVPLLSPAVAGVGATSVLLRNV